MFGLLSKEPSVACVIVTMQYVRERRLQLAQPCRCIFYRMLRIAPRSTTSAIDSTSFTTVQNSIFRRNDLHGHLHLDSLHNTHNTDTFKRHSVNRSTVSLSLIHKERLGWRIDRNKPQVERHKLTVWVANLLLPD